jgi:probable addiction module antidote protein
MAKSGVPAVVVQALIAIARTRGMSRIAHETGLGRESLYKSLSPEGHPEFGTCSRCSGHWALNFMPSLNRLFRCRTGVPQGHAKEGDRFRRCAMDLHFPSTDSRACRKLSPRFICENILIYQNFLLQSLSMGMEDCNKPLNQRVINRRDIRSLV